MATTFPRKNDVGSPACTTSKALYSRGTKPPRLRASEAFVEDNKGYYHFK